MKSASLQGEAWRWRTRPSGRAPRRQGEGGLRVALTLYALARINVEDAAIRRAERVD